MDLIKHTGANVIRFPGGGIQKPRKSGNLGRPRTRPYREPRQRKPVVILDVKPTLGLLPASDADRALPPSRRLSLAQQIDLAYTQQQTRATRVKLERTDRMVYSEIVLDWKIEIWQDGKTRGTDKPTYFYRTQCLVLGAVGGAKGKGRFKFESPQNCLTAARYRVRERETQWRDYGRRVSHKRRFYTFRRYSRIYSVAPEAKPYIEPLTISELLANEATCPICRKIVERERQTLNEHLSAHVSASQITGSQQFEIVSFLIAS